MSSGASDRLRLLLDEHIAGEFALQARTKCPSMAIQSIHYWDSGAFVGVVELRPDGADRWLGEVLHEEIASMLRAASAGREADPFVYRGVDPAVPADRKNRATRVKNTVRMGIRRSLQEVG